MTSNVMNMQPSHSKKLQNLNCGGVSRHTASALTFSRSWLVHIANETLDICHDRHYTNQHGQVVDLHQPLQLAIKNSVHYHSSHVFSPPTKQPGPFDTKFHICYGSSLNVAAQLEKEAAAAAAAQAAAGDASKHTTNQQHYHIGILNSASSKGPSKFLRGTVSQEECICRASLLYPCLAQFEGKPHHMYVVNNKPKYASSSSSCAIFSPHVPVIRRDTAHGELLDEYHLYSFCSIPAPNAFVVGSMGNGTDEDNKHVPKAALPGANDEENYEALTLQEAMRDRLYRVLSMFVLGGCTELVLCAFGCGVHGNCPEMTATIFRDLLQNEFKGQFRTVVFGIQQQRTSNFHAFCQVFPEATRGGS